MKMIIKDPNAELDYKWDWSDWLPDGVTIASATVTAPTGLTVDSSSVTDGNTCVTAWISGGTANTDYEVICRITTNNDPEHIDDRTMVIRIANK